MKLGIEKADCIDNWYVIYRVDVAPRIWFEKTGDNVLSLMDSTRISDADVEGTRIEMLALADAIVEKKRIEFHRCAIDATQEPIKLWSPRNSRKDGKCSHQDALDLANKIKAELE